VRYYLGAAPARSQADVRLAALQPIAALAGGASTTRTTTLAMPPGIKPGTYYLIACADDLGQIAEANETDNCRVAADPVAVRLPASAQWWLRRAQ
jgi:hypothetical protein